MPINIDNETHWRTPDIRSVVKESAAIAGIPDARVIKVNVTYNTKKVTSRRSRGRKTVGVSHITYNFKSTKRQITLALMFPKNGPKEIHDVPMVAVAAAAAAPTSGDLLAASQTFWLANALADRFAREPGSGARRDDDLWELLVKDEKDWSPPSWTDASKLLVCKVKDPLKDGTYLDFVKKKTAALKRAETAIEKETAAIEAAKRRLKKAKERKKEIEKSLKSAKERRS
jgi:hypothetical protein